MNIYEREFDKLRFMTVWRERGFGPLMRRDETLFLSFFLSRLLILALFRVFVYSFFYLLAVLISSQTGFYGCLFLCGASEALFVFSG